MTDLVACAAAGDDAAFAQLALAHRRQIEVLASRRFAPGLDRDDIEQEALIALHHAVRSYDPCNHGEIPFALFADVVISRRLDTVVKTALRAKHSFLNERVRFEYQIGSEEDESLGNMIGDERLDVVELLHSRERLATVIRILAELTEHERTAIVGLASGVDYRTVADELGRSTKSIDNSFQRARRKLGAALANLEEAA